MEGFSMVMCRVCEQQFNLIDISIPAKQNYVEMFLACADVTVRKKNALFDNNRKYI